jgi:hypothetical protein
MPLSATASGDQRFEVGLHDAPDATDIAVALQCLHPEPAFAPGIAEGFEHDIEADLVAILEAIGEGLGDIVNPDRPPFDFVGLHAGSQSSAREAHYAEPGIGKRWCAAATITPGKPYGKNRGLAD